MRRARILLRQNKVRKTMLRLAVITERPERFTAMADSIVDQSRSAAISWYHSERAALEAVADASPDLMVIDENFSGSNAVAFLQRLMAVNAMINTAVASCLSREDFHETYEGLGVLMQLPPVPDRVSSEDLLGRLKAISGIS
jgi:chemotaxis response regulator CheB